MQFEEYFYHIKTLIFIISFGSSILYFLPKGVFLLAKWEKQHLYADLALGVGFFMCGLFILLYLLGTLLVSYALNFAS